MSIRTQVLLLAGVALGLVTALGVVLSQSAAQATELRSRVTTLEQQLDLYSELHHQAWDYLRQLFQASRLKTDTRGLLREYEQILHEDLSQLQEHLDAEKQWADFPPDPASQLMLESIIEAQRLWGVGVEVVLRPTERGEPPGSDDWAELFTSYEHQVTPLVDQRISSLREKRRQLDLRLEQTLQRTRWVGRLVPIAATALLGLLSATLLIPLLRQLRELRASAERLDGGDFSAELSAHRDNELGALAQAVNRMAEELRTSLREKEKMLQTQAEAAELERRREAEIASRDLHRYNSALEQMVRSRTGELESANTQLAASLRQLQTMQAQLIFTDRLASMGRLAAGVGHEINNPLAYVLSNLSYVYKELHRTQGTPPSDEDREELLTAVKEAKDGAERVRIIVQDLKTLSRPDDVSGGRAELKEVVRAAAKIASHEIRRRARLVEELGEVPPVLGSASRLGQVFLNLLINAAQAIPEGDAEQNEIRVMARQENPQLVVVEIRDTGCGIPPENLDRIFDPFFTTKPVGEGTGLGLSLVHSILTALGATITVQSQPGQGTTFRLGLPAAPNVS
ncbi:sensor histidine kinase [Hyalangium versicolor]|uniref:sensor histidine kinase n=1 Tax=Hyalangium versicolor TaxID=2861190 RepID=UPI00272BA615|nr:ATP-binding protein [Hyalangium versicolor]